MKPILKTILATAIIVMSLVGNLLAQSPTRLTTDSFSLELLHWQHQDPDNTKIPGVATYRAYDSYLKTLPPKKKIVVAVIDSGVDIAHEDLVGNIWVNADEIPDNGMDDDANGYVDDVNGWNFLGSTNGDMAEHETLELTRIIRKYKPMFDGKEINDIPPGQVDLYKTYRRALANHKEQYDEYQSAKVQYDRIFNEYRFSIRLLKAAMKVESINNDALKAYIPPNKDLERAKNIVTLFRANGYHTLLKESLQEINSLLDYNLNLAFDGRAVVGDDPDDLNDRDYGNHDIAGPDPTHGTFVASMIAAKRGNGLGVDGVADHVLIMPIRAVPNGDEYDKDIALAIRYAVDNGAHIINMSFGKEFTQHKEWVDEAMAYAAQHNVLLVHAAGNDSKDNDKVASYPNKFMLTGGEVSTWLEVGASSKENGKELCGSFTNYGQTTVDIFAPGVSVIGCMPDNYYKALDGTSFACPITSGVAALVWSRYPSLTALELKEILLESSYSLERKKVKLPGEEKKKVRFGALSVSGGVVNAYRALELAAKKS